MSPKKNLFLAKFGDEDHVDSAMDSGDIGRQRASTYNPKFSEDHITKALDSKDLLTRNLAMRSKHVTTDHITKALNDENI